MRPPVIKSSWKKNRSSAHSDLVEATDLVEVASDICAISSVTAT